MHFKNNLFVLLSIFVSSVTNAQTWEKINMSFPESDTLLISSSISFATKNIGWIFTSGEIDDNIPRKYSAKILKTTDGGNSWFLQKYLGDFFASYSICVLDSLHCWAIDESGDLMFTSNGGADWDTSYISGMGGDYFTSIFFFNSQTGIAFNRYRSFTTDGGYSWLQRGETAMTFPIPSDVYFVNNRLGWMVSEMTPYASDAGYIARTIDSGKTWSYQDSIAPKMSAVHFIDSLRGFAVGTNVDNSTGFIYSTTDGGNIWSWKQFIGSNAFWDIGFLDGQNGWIAGVDKILKTTDGGESWEIQMQGFQSELRKLMVLKKDKIAYAFGDNHYQAPFTLLYADLSHLTSVKSDAEDIPKAFHLAQNYPNPFNPTTVISYQLPNDAKVTLNVFDILGREIATLVDGEVVAGNHTATFDGSRLSSGIYFVRLTATPQEGSIPITKTMKMLMMK
jgi:photosystem II stability/assembly factor-like uncharacterized protein